MEQPEAEIAIQIENPAAFGEHFDRLRADIRTTPTSVEVSAGDADAYGGKLRFQGSYQHRMSAGKADWKNGTLRFEVAAQGVAVSRIGPVSKLMTNAVFNAGSNANAKIDGKATGTARLVNNELTLDSIDGDATARGLIWNQQPLSGVVLNAETRGGDVAVRGGAKIRDVNIDAQGSWKLAGDNPGSATVRFSRATVATLHDVFMAGGPLADTVLPFEGFIDGARANISVALRKSSDFRAELTIDQVQLDPRAAQTLRLGAQAPDIVVKNSKPVTVDISSKEARIRSADFTARDTTLEVTGAMPLDASSGAALNVRGSVNLIVLQLLNRDLAARGNATVQVSVRGSLKDPQVNGRMELKNASLYLSDLPNGVDNANGAVIFDRNRATIEKLTAETGGGKITFTGFIGFGSTLVYRLQAVADKVRVRYPEDVSTTFNATLALNGTSDASTVSGVVTMTRASFTPRADFAQILAQAGRPVSAPVAASDYVKGIQFDVRIESGPNFEFQTSLARNLEAEIDLRLRGTPIRPVLLGSVSVNDGEVEMFGNRYTVNRGDIRFSNPVRVDPIFDMDLETKARSVTVNIAISGTMQKLNINYSSDPPMQPREIIALLAVGRTPLETSGLNSTPSTASSTSMNEAGASLIGSGDLRAAIQPAATILRREPCQDRSHPEWRRIPAASAPDSRAAGFKRDHAHLHHQFEPHGRTDRADRVGFQPAMVLRGHARSERSVRNRFHLPKKIQMSASAAEDGRAAIAPPRHSRSTRFERHAADSARRVRTGKAARRGLLRCAARDRAWPDHFAAVHDRADGGAAGIARR